MYGIVLKENTGLSAKELATYLYKHEIETRPFFLGMHEQPVFKKMRLFKEERFPVAEQLSKQGLYLPSGLTMTEHKINEVVTSILKFLH